MCLKICSLMSKDNWKFLHVRKIAKVFFTNACTFLNYRFNVVTKTKWFLAKLVKIISNVKYENPFSHQVSLTQHSLLIEKRHWTAACIYLWIWLFFFCFIDIYPSAVGFCIPLRTEEFQWAPAKSWLMIMTNSALFLAVNVLTFD